MSALRDMLRAQTLRDIFAKTFDRVFVDSAVQDNFQKIWRDLDPTIQMKWIVTARLIAELHAVMDTPSRQTPEPPDTRGDGQ